MRSTLSGARDHTIPASYPARQEISTGVYARAMAGCRGGAQGATVAWDETLDSGPWERTPIMSAARDHVISGSYPARQEISTGVYARAMAGCRGGAQGSVYGWYRGGSSLNSVDVEGRIGFSDTGGGGQVKRIRFAF